MERRYRISIHDWCARTGFDSLEDAVELLDDSVVPALCDEGCEVEPDNFTIHKPRCLISSD